MSEDSILIDVHHGSQSESWLVVYRDGRIRLHSENDGHYAMRHGIEPRDVFIAMEDVRRLERTHGKNLAEQVEGAIRRLNEGAP